jgi:hypothetical protein
MKKNLVFFDGFISYTLTDHPEPAAYHKRSTLFVKVGWTLAQPTLHHNCDKLF